jgi:hypothetical protein
MAGITISSSITNPINGSGSKLTAMSAPAAALGTGLPVSGMPALGVSFVRDERPAWALKASVAAAARGCVGAVGAGNSPQHHQDQQTTDLTQATYVTPAPDGMQVAMRAFRGLEPWRERT